MIHALVSGQLASDPQARNSAKGTAFATGSVRSGSGDEAVFVNVVCFAEMADRLLQLHKGDAVSVAGRAELKTWTTRDGSERSGLSIVATEIAAARPQPREAPQRQRSAPRPAYDGPTRDDGGDDLYARGGP